MKFNLSIASVILIALFTLNGCSKTESPKAVTVPVQVIDEKLKPFIGKWGVPKVNDCSDGGVTISEKIITIGNAMSINLKLKNDGGIDLSEFSPSFSIYLSDDKSHLLIATDEGGSPLTKCESGKFKVIKTDGRNKDYSLTVFVESEDGLIKNLELSLSAGEKSNIHDFVKSSVGKVLMFEYETIYDEDIKSKFNLISNVK